jgi:hypothetical protein
MSLPRRYIDAQIEEEKRRIRRRPITSGAWDETLPDGTPALEMGMPAWREQLDTLPTRQVSVASAQPAPDDNVIDFPTRNRAGVQGIIPEVPLELPTYARPNVSDIVARPSDQAQTNDAVLRPGSAPGTATPVNTGSATRPRVTTPEVIGAPGSEDLPTRPRLVNPKGTVEYQDQLLSDLQNNPRPEMSRKKAAGYNFLRNLATGGIGPALIGAAVGAIAPGATSKMRHEDEVAKATGQLNSALKRDEERALIEQRRRQPEKDYQNALRAEREKRIANLMTMHDRAGHYNPEDPNDKASQMIKAQAEALGVADQLIPYTKADKVPPHLNVDGTEYERQQDGSWAPAKGLPTRAMVNVPGYGPMTPAAARNADAVEGERVYRHGRDTIEDTRKSDEVNSQNKADLEEATRQRTNASIYDGNADTNDRLAEAQDTSTDEGWDRAKEYKAEAVRQRAAAKEAREKADEAERKAKSRPPITVDSLPTRGGGKRGRTPTYKVNTSKYGLP